VTSNGYETEGSHKRHFADDEDAICTANGWLEEQDNRIQALKKCCTKFPSVECDYVEIDQNMMYIYCDLLCQVYKLLNLHHINDIN